MLSVYLEELAIREAEINRELKRTSGGGGSGGDYIVEEEIGSDL